MVEWGFLLKHEAISRNVAWREGKSLLHVLLPILHRLAGETKHKVDAHVVDTRIPHYLHSLHGLQGGVAASDEAQPLVAERLHAHADAVYAHRLHLCHKLRCNVVGVHLYRNLACLNGERIVHRGKYALQFVCLQHGWRAAANIDGVDRVIIAKFVPPKLHFFQQSVGVAML